MFLQHIQKTNKKNNPIQIYSVQYHPLNTTLLFFQIANGRHALFSWKQSEIPKQHRTINSKHTIFPPNSLFFTYSLHKPTFLSFVANVRSVPASKFPLPVGQKPKPHPHAASFSSFLPDLPAFSFSLLPPLLRRYTHNAVYPNRV